MADLDNLTEGYAEAWDQFVEGTHQPEAYLARHCSNDNAKERAKNVGRRQAARDFAVLRKATS